MSALAEEIDAAFTRALHAQEGGQERLNAEEALRRVLWDNKAGIVAGLRAATPPSSSSGTDGLRQALERLASDEPMAAIVSLETDVRIDFARKALAGVAQAAPETDPAGLEEIIADLRREKLNQIEALERIRDFPYIGEKAAQVMALIARQALAHSSTPRATAAPQRATCCRN